MSTRPSIYSPAHWESEVGEHPGVTTECAINPDEIMVWVSDLRALVASVDPGLDTAHLDRARASGVVVRRSGGRWRCDGYIVWMDVPQVDHVVGKWGLRVPGLGLREWALAAAELEQPIPSINLGLVVRIPKVRRST